MILTFFLRFLSDVHFRVPKAEREGFEPPAPLSATVFKTVVIDHSTISPCLERILCSNSKASAKVKNFI